MRVSDGAVVCVTGVIVALSSGCVDLAQVNYGPEEERWQQALRQSYPGYRAPRTPPPAVIEAPGVKNSPAEVMEIPAAPVQPEAAPQAVVDDAAGDKAIPAADAAADMTAKEAKNDGATEKAAETAETPAPAATPAATPAVAPAAAGTKEPLDPTVGREIYVVRPGDDLSRISKKFYGNPNCYDPIVKANSDLIRNPNRLRPGMKLIIPAL